MADPFPSPQEVREPREVIAAAVWDHVLHPYRTKAEAERVYTIAAPAILAALSDAGFVLLRREDVEFLVRWLANTENGHVHDGGCKWCDITVRMRSALSATPGGPT